MPSIALDPRVPSAPAPAPIPLAPGNIPRDPQVNGRAEAADASATARLRTPVSAATWDNTIPEMAVNDAPEIGADPTVVTPTAGDPEVDPNSIQELMKLFIQRSNEMDASRSKKPKWQEELEKEIDPAAQKKRNIARALVAFGSTLAKTPGNFLTGVAQASGPGAQTYIEGQDASREKRQKALQGIDQFHRGNEDASLSRLGTAIGLSTAAQKALGAGKSGKKTEAMIKAEARVKAIQSAEGFLRKGATADNPLPGYDTLLETRNRWGSAASGIGGRGAMTGEGQAALDSLKSVIQIAIYSLSGAQAPETEVNRLLGLATPGVMDGEEAIANKKAQVMSFLDMIHTQAGQEMEGPSPEAVIAEDENGNRKVFIPQLNEWVEIE